MAAPKIKLKRSTSTVSTTDTKSLDIGEPVIDLSTAAEPKLWIGNNLTPQQTTKVWIGAAIEDSPSNWASATKIATQNAINTRFMPKTGGTFTGAITAPGITSTNGISTSGSLTSTGGSLVLKETGGGANTITITAPSDVTGNVTYTLPDVPNASGKVLTSDTSGTLSWGAASNGITITEATTPGGGATKTYNLLLTDTVGNNVTEIYTDGSPGLLPTNGPLQYNKTTGAFVVNGNIVVNGPAASTVFTPTRGNTTADTISDGDTVFTFASGVDFSGLAVGQEIAINGAYTAPSGITVTLGEGVSITNINNGSKTITISSGISVKTTAGNSTTLSCTAGQANFLLSVATGIIDIGPNATGNSIGNLYNTTVSTINIGRTDATAINLGKAASTVTVGTTGGNSTLIINGNSTSGVATLDMNAQTVYLANSTATQLYLGGASTSVLNIGANDFSGTTNLRSNIVSIGTGTLSKAINIGPSGTSGTTTSVTIGSNNGATNSITIHGAITNTAGSSPTDANQLTSKQYVDSVAAAGLTSKNPVRVATTTSGTLSSSFENGDIIDGVTLSTGDRILIKDQATKSENGIYVVASSGAPTRATDADTAGELAKGTYVFVTAGTANAGKGFILRTGVSALGTSDLDWDQFTTSTNYTFSSGLTNTSGTITVNAASGGGLSVSGSGVSVASSFAGKGLTLSSGVLTVDGHTTVRVATVTSGTLSSSFKNGDTVDGVALVTNDRILIKNQSNPSENGIYVVAASGAPTRATDADSSAEILSLRRVYVTSGTANTGKVFELTNTSAITVGTTQINYVEDSATGGTSFAPEQYMVIGAGLDRTSNATAKSYTLSGTWAKSGTCAAGEATFTISFGNSGDVILDSVYPGMNITKLGSTFTSDLIIDSINRNATPRTIIVRYMGTSTSSYSITAAGSATDFIINGVTSAGLDSYDTSKHKGILVYGNKDYSTWSAFGYNKTGNYWSVFNQGSTVEYPISTLTGTETLINKTLTSPKLNYPAYNTSTYINDGSVPAGATGAIQNAYMWDPFIRTTYLLSAERTSSYIWAKDHDLGYTQKWMTTDPVSYAAIAQTVPSTGANTDVINISVPSNPIELRTGHAVRALAIGSADDNGIANDTIYYIIKVGPSSIKLASTYANAMTGTAIQTRGTIIDTGSNYLRFYTYINTTKLGSVDVVGGGSYLQLANTENSGKYDTVFGDYYGLTETTTTNIGASGDSIGSTYSYVITAINDGITTAPDGDFLNIDLGTVSSIVLDGTATATITFTAVPTAVNQRLTANKSYIMLYNVNTSSSSVNTLMNFYHKVTNWSAGSQTVTVELRRAATGLSGTYSTNVGSGIKNYEVKVIMAAGAPTYSVGDAITFSSTTPSTSAVSHIVIGDYTGLGSADRMDSTSWSTGNAATTTARITTSFTSAGSRVFSFRCPYPINNLASAPAFGNYGTLDSTLRLSITTAQELATTYTGRRVLLNTLIDCGSY